MTTWHSLLRAWVSDDHTVFVTSLCRVFIGRSAAGGVFIARTLIGLFFKKGTGPDHDVLHTHTYTHTHTTFRPELEVRAWAWPRAVGAIHHAPTALHAHAPRTPSPARYAPLLPKAWYACCKVHMLQGSVLRGRLQGSRLQGSKLHVRMLQGSMLQGSLLQGSMVAGCKVHPKIAAHMKPAALVAFHCMCISRVAFHIPCMVYHGPCWPRKCASGLDLGAQIDKNILNDKSETRKQMANFVAKPVSAAEMGRHAGSRGEKGRHGREGQKKPEPRRSHQGRHPKKERDAM